MGEARPDLTFGNITLVPGKRGGEYPFCNTLVIDDDARALVDPAAGRKKMTAVREQRDADVIIVTHHHEDHWWHSYLFPGAEIWMHEADAGAMRSLDDLFRHQGLNDPALREQWGAILKERFHFSGWTPRRLKSGETLRIGATVARVVHTPGHTPGHICVHFPE
ncbi:MAG: MBL fold metallo-hydrolase, partial [bacterium]